VPKIPSEIEQAAASSLLPAQLREVTLDLCLLLLGQLFVVQPVDQGDRVPPKQREELRFNGIGPGDSYLGMWRMVNLYRRRLDQIVTRISHHERRGAFDAGELAKLERDERYYSEQITHLYSKLLVHEKPKVQAIEVKGDPASPLYHEADLKNLPDEDLDALARILPKLGGTTGEHACLRQKNPPRNRGFLRQPSADAGADCSNNGGRRHRRNAGPARNAIDLPRSDLCLE
jgi:hypothetical protein